jgi:hypothetical protein
VKNHRHLRIQTAQGHLVCFISTVNGRSNKKEKKRRSLPPWKAGASSGHITNLKQSILDFQYLCEKPTNCNTTASFTALESFILQDSGQLKNSVLNCKI